MNPLAQDIWPEREKVLAILKEKKIKASDMARRFKKSKKNNWLLNGLRA